MYHRTVQINIQCICKCICIIYSIHVHVQWKPSNQLINKSFVVVAMHTCAAFDPKNEDTVKVQRCPDEMSSTVHLYIHTCIIIYFYFGCAVLLCLVCLTLLASFFLPSLISH